ncbi:MAG: 30S ribosomal protein S16 [Candidatus Omnitrophota bacterium]
MAVKIRMKRFGSKNRPQWRVVVSDAKMPRDGRFIEEIGYYDALPKEDIFVVKQDRLEYWVKQGAQMSAALKSLVRREKKKTKAKKSA